MQSKREFHADEVENEVQEEKFGQRNEKKRKQRKQTEGRTNGMTIFHLLLLNLNQ